jgi:hypothetical protein
MQNAGLHFRKSNPWIEEEPRAWMCNMFITKDISAWRRYDVVLSTSGADRVMTIQTAARVMLMLPSEISWDGCFALGLRDTESWREELLKRAETDDTVCFVNFRARGLVKSDDEVYKECEEQKMLDFRMRVCNNRVVINSRDVVLTGTDPDRELHIGQLPGRGRVDVVVARAEVVDAMPDAALRAHLRDDRGVIIHFGRLTTAKDIQTLDASVFNMESYTDWVRGLNHFLLSWSRPVVEAS